MTEVICSFPYLIGKSAGIIDAVLNRPWHSELQLFFSSEKERSLSMLSSQSVAL